jgi:L-histidine Nalpha-methyltransferase
MSARESFSFLPEIAEDVVHGLTGHPKSLPPKLFYDEAGSRLFDEITTLPEYYLTRTERALLKEYAGDILRQFMRRHPRPAANTSRYSASPSHDARSNHNAPLSVVELGAGTSEKTTVLLHALMEQRREATYYPVDVCREVMLESRRRLSAQFRGLSVKPIVADYTRGLRELTEINGHKLVMYIGSSVGNFEPMEASLILRAIGAALAPGDALLLGTDLVKDASVLIPAYDDPAGVTARFNKNILARINRELGGHFDLDRFRHVIEWNPEASRIEIYLESTRAQLVPIDLLQLCVHFSVGERIHTENSYKFTPQMIGAVLHNGGFALERTWTDRRRWFGLHLARVAT